MQESILPMLRIVVDKHDCQALFKENLLTIL